MNDDDMYLKYGKVTDAYKSKKITESHIPKLGTDSFWSLLLFCPNGRMHCFCPNYFTDHASFFGMIHKLHYCNLVPMLSDGIIFFCTVKFFVFCTVKFIFNFHGNEIFIRARNGTLNLRFGVVQINVEEELVLK